MKTSIFFLSIMLFTNNIRTNISLELPKREGNKPKTVYSVPHAQLDQTSPMEVVDDLADWLFSLDYVYEKSSRGSLPSARGAYIESSKLRWGAYKEFTHIHYETGLGSLHAFMDGKSAAEVVSMGWGEYHPMNAGATEKSRNAIVMIYAPRNQDDLRVVKEILIAAHRYAVKE